MIQEKQLRSNQRLLRTFVNRTRQELNKLLSINPRDQREAGQWNHSKNLLTALLRGAEQTLTLVDFFLGDGRTITTDSTYGNNLANALELYHLANAMYEHHDGFLVRVVNDPNNPTESDVEWAEDRLDAFNLIKQLIGKPNETTSIENILKYGAFCRPRTAPATINLPNNMQQVREDRAEMDKVLSRGTMADPSFLSRLKPNAANTAADVKAGRCRPIIDWQNLTGEQKRQAQAQLRRGVENDPSLGGFLEVCFGMPAGTLVSAASARQEQASRVENVLNVIRRSSPQEPSAERETTTEPSAFRRPAYGQSAQKSTSTDAVTDEVGDEVRIDLDEMADRVADEAEGDEDVIGLDRLIEKAISQYPELKQALTDPNSGYGIALLVSRR
jgi:hypothetical protein